MRLLARRDQRQFPRGGGFGLPGTGAEIHSCIFPSPWQAGSALRLALSTLCENPERKTGLTTFFHEFVRCSLALFADVEWIVFVGANQDWPMTSPRVEVVRRYPANDRLARRLLADHFLVPADARRRGADALLTVGFVPVAKRQPTILHLFSLQHLDRSNRMEPARRLYRSVLMGRSVRHAELIITNSQSAAGQIRAAYRSAVGQMLISPEGLQHEQFTSATDEGEAARLKEKFGLKPGYLLWVSNFYPYKQAPLLLAAYARLDPALRLRHPLVMAGGTWHGGSDARAYATSLGISADVRFLGWVDDADLAPLYRQARAFVLPTREETFGRCVIEAMACGTPCVVNEIPVMREITGGHATIVDFADPPAAAAALDSIVRDEALHARLLAEGMAWTQRYSFERLATERIEAIREMLTRAGSPKES